MLFGATRRLPDCVCVLLRKYLAEVDVGLVGDELRGGFHIAVRDLITLLKECAQLREQALHLVHVGRRAVNDHIVPLRAQTHTELRFDGLEILVVRAEECLDALFRKRDSCQCS